MTCDNTHRLLYQYQHSPSLKGLTLDITREYCALEVVNTDMLTRLDIDASVGFQLDQIGIIVGQPRPLVYEIDDDEIFVFDDPEGEGPWSGEGKGWSGVGRGDVGGRFIGLNAEGLPEASLVGSMPDLDYRTLLRARIYSNKADTTIESIVEFLNYSLRTGGNTVINGVGKIDLIVGKVLSSAEVIVIRSLCPVAAGVLLDNIYDPENPAP